MKENDVGNRFFYLSSQNFLYIMYKIFNSIYKYFIKYKSFILYTSNHSILHLLANVLNFSSHKLI